MSALDRLCARIEKRSARLRAAHMQAVPRSLDAARFELDTLGPYVSGEARKSTRRRAYLERWLAQRSPLRGRYAHPEPMPTTLGLARTELLALGPYLLGEPGHVSRRRAALTRAFPDLAALALQIAIEELGTWRPSEPDAVSKRRAALVRQLDRLAKGM